MLVDGDIMVHMYEKVCKTEENQYGIREVIDENPLEKGPCIITILPSPGLLSEINGSMLDIGKSRFAFLNISFARCIIISFLTISLGNLNSGIP